MDYYIRKTEKEDILKFASVIRPEDVKENQIRFAGKEILECLAISFTFSQKCFTIKNTDGSPMGLFGVYRNLKGEGEVWLVTSKEVMKRGFLKGLCRYWQIWEKVISKNCTKLHNYVWTGNAMHIRLIKYLGFTIVEEPVIISNEEFLYFYKDIKE